MRVTIANGEEETVNTAPWRRRSLLRRPRWARGAALIAKRGLRMLLTLRRHKEQATLVDASYAKHLEDRPRP